ncbi:MAG: abortive infection family protein [Alphaproteobacteria bacterium]|jgi:hypothetical protein|nr:abortive infection family protein [Alphaproteobacteria bacterium]
MSDGINPNEAIPEDSGGRARLLQVVLLRACEGHRTPADDAVYTELRRVMMHDPALKSLLPGYVQRHRDLGHLWPYLKEFDPKWEPRRQHVRNTLTPLFDRVEVSVDDVTADDDTTDVLQGFETASVYAFWQKALERRHTDPEGAIASARTLLETVCKHILDGRGVTYSVMPDLPALMKMTVEQLDVAPNQYAQASFKRLLVDAASAVDGLRVRRNGIATAYGHAELRIRPSERHAQLAVNMAGAAAIFLVESWDVRVEEDFLDMIDDSKGG